MPRYLSQIDTSQIPVKGFVPETVATLPASPVNGQVVYHTADHKIKAYQNGAWVTLDANTTYTVGTVAQAQAGSDTTGRLWPATALKAAAESHAPVKSVAGKTGAVILEKGDVGLGNVDNTSDANKPVSTATQTALNLKANIASPTFTGSPKAPTAASSTNTTQIATTAFVQTLIANMAQGISAKNTVRAATTQSIVMSGLQTIDGVSIAAGDSVLVKNQTASSTNGIYIASTGTWARRADADTWDELVSAFTFVQEGISQADTGWLCTANRGGTIGSDAIPWIQFSSAGQIEAGDGLSKVGNVLEVSLQSDGGLGISGLGGGIVIAASGVKTASIADANVTEAKLGSIPLTSSKFTGALPLTKGGTGATTAAGARANIAAAGGGQIFLPALSAGVWTTLDWPANISTFVAGVDFRDTTTGENVQLDYRIRTAAGLAYFEVKPDVSVTAGALYLSMVGW